MMMNAWIMTLVIFSQGELSQGPVVAYPEYSACEDYLTQTVVELEQQNNGFARLSKDDWETTSFTIIFPDHDSQAIVSCKRTLRKEDQ